jgi:hypothetical protein
MAMEVAFQHYLFRSSNDEGLKGNTGKESYRSVLASMKKVALPLRFTSKRNSKRHFFHNPLHDAESIWWGCIELVFRRRIECGAFPDLMQEYKELYTILKGDA